MTCLFYFYYSDTHICYQIQRQEQKEADDNVRHQLDQELDSIRSLLLRPDPVSESLVRSSDGLNTGKAEEKDQEYDQFIRELVFDKRARPKDRLKTEEELALEEKEKLEKEERRRIRRMNGEDEASSSEDEGRSRKRKRPRGGDDLEDDFMLDGNGGLGAGLGGDEDEDSEGEDEESDETQMSLRVFRDEEAEPGGKQSPGHLREREEEQRTSSERIDCA